MPTILYKDIHGDTRENSGSALDGCAAGYDRDLRCCQLAVSNGDHDTDGDGLIEIRFLEQLDAVRYDLNGDGKAEDDAGGAPYAVAFPGTVCDSNCHGYELTRSLDFQDAESYASGVVNTAWTTGEGWEPIQGGELWGIVAERLFAATFDGNGHTISNLYINRSGGRR